MNLQALVCFIFPVLFFSCSDNRKNTPVSAKAVSKDLYDRKPPATVPDTIKINSIAAVFYSPDSIQLQKIRSGADPDVYGSNMHEYEYLIKTANSVIKKDFPEVNIIEAKNARYLLFITADKKVHYIDLDKNYDPYGLYVFDRQKAPQVVDMANTETDLGFYFSK